MKQHFAFITSLRGAFFLHSDTLSTMKPKSGANDLFCFFDLPRLKPDASINKNHNPLSHNRAP